MFWKKKRRNNEPYNSDDVGPVLKLFCFFFFKREAKQRDGIRISSFIASSDYLSS